MWFLDNAWLVPLIPAVSFVLILFFGKRLPRQRCRGRHRRGRRVVRPLVRRARTSGSTTSTTPKAAAHGVDAALGALGRSVGRLDGQEGRGTASRSSRSPSTVTWFQNGGVNLGVGIQIDGLTVMMMFVVTLISLLVHVYSTEYMRGDRRFTHFYAALSLFTASMLLLVVADNTLQMLVGWELVGLCSFMLIGHWWEEKPNSDAALKAFLTTRTGDIGLLIGVIMTFFIVQAATGHGSFNIIAVNEAALSGDVEPHARAVVRALGVAVRRSSASRVSSRCTRGSPTPWPARLRSPR